MDWVGEVCVDLLEAATPSTGRSKLGKLGEDPRGVIFDGDDYDHDYDY